MTTSVVRRPRFGVQLQAQRTTWPEYLAAVRAVEELGFDTLWNFDHLLPPMGAEDGACFETWTTLAAMAMATSRIRIGVLVNGVLYRDPATLAKSAAMVDHISNGRLEFSLGAAWAEREFAAYGLPFPPIGERMERLIEALDVVKLLWTESRATYAGKHYSLQDAPCEPKPLQQPYPPIMIGGNGRRTLRIAARYADVWNGFGSPEQCRDLIATLSDDCRAIGRDVAEIEFSLHPSLAIAETHEAAEELAQAIARSNGQTIEDRSNWMIGTPDEVRTRLQEYVAVGVTHWIVGLGAPYDMTPLRLFAREVMPAFR